MCSKSQGFYGLNSPLSPAAQAVVSAIQESSYDWGNMDQAHPNVIAAAALRVAADQGKRGPEHWEGSQPDDWDTGWEEALRFIDDIATELERADG